MDVLTHYFLDCHWQSFNKSISLQQQLEIDMTTTQDFVGPQSKFKSGTLGPSSKFKSGTLIIIFLYGLTYIVLDKHVYNMEIIFHELLVF